MIDKGAIPTGKKEKENFLDGVLTAFNKLHLEIEENNYTADDIKRIIKDAIEYIEVEADE